MRERKYKAWDKTHKIMGGSKPLATWIFCNTERMITGEDKLYFRDTIFLEYTGIKDKNGEEIHEGDILSIIEKPVPGKQHAFGTCTVKFGKWDCTCGDYYCSEHGLGFYVEGYHGYQREDGRRDSYETLETILNYLDTYEVIGNIYQHPHLLEKAE